jgi:hypothetical protein
MMASSPPAIPAGVGARLGAAVIWAREAFARLRTAWFVLRGDAVMRRVIVRDGHVEFDGRRLSLSASTLADNTIYTGGIPVVFKADGSSIVVDNTGDIAGPPREGTLDS